jgi:SAM-dependent methyltransferase
MAVSAPQIDAEAWQSSWDRQQQSYLPDREERFAAMVDTVEAVAGSAPRVLDLAGGTGSISLRVLARFPEARSTLVDVDVALLGIAAATVVARGLDERMTVVAADLADPEWTAAVTGPYDAILTATALHWLAETDLRRVYEQAHGLLRDGGVLVNADHHADDGLPTLSPLLRDVRRTARAVQQIADPTVEWSGWWEAARADEALAPLVSRRDARFGSDHAAEFTPTLRWHEEALRAAGFREVGLVWRGLTDAAVCGVR